MRRDKSLSRPSKRRRLKLRRETLREINEIDLTVVVGGSDDDEESTAVVLDNGSG